MQKEDTVHGEVKDKRSVLTSIIVGGVGAFSAVYLLNPTAGFLELIPDNLPVVGNLDEAAAAALLVSCLAYFGVDIGGLFGRKKKDEASDIIDVEAQA
ncbi:MAG: DUF1232 domain-containing protein [Verrucomicrobiales bacterium]|nr:DUF1232 domain-containing protein [Verrucomicrobiales bacterium]